LYRLGKRPIKKWQLQEMACELQTRGHDATGFALMDEDGKVYAWKTPKPAWVAVAEKAFDEWADTSLSDRTRIMLCHTRAFTKGSPFVHANNHPLFAQPTIQGLVVHNGMIRNDDGLFEVNKKSPAFQRSCATDSDALRALLDAHGGIDKDVFAEMSLAEGTAAVAAIHRSSPGKLLLLRDSNPLVIGCTRDTIGFASTKEALHKALKPWIKMHNIPMQVHAPDLSFVPFPNETGWIIGPKGLEVHGQFKCNGKGYGGYTKYVKNTNYHDRQERARSAAKTDKTFTGVQSLAASDPVVKSAYPPSWSVDNKRETDPELFEFVICPNLKCNKHVELSPEDRQLASIAQLACQSCNTNLAGALDASLSVN
jgi:predicted glutamine amidotransferase